MLWVVLSIVTSLPGTPLTFENLQARVYNDIRSSAPEAQEEWFSTQQAAYPDGMAGAPESRAALFSGLLNDAALTPDVRLYALLELYNAYNEIGDNFQCVQILESWRALGLETTQPVSDVVFALDHRATLQAIQHADEIGWPPEELIARTETLLSEYGAYSGEGVRLLASLATHLAVEAKLAQGQRAHNLALTSVAYGDRARIIIADVAEGRVDLLPYEKELLLARSGLTELHLQDARDALRSVIERQERENRGEVLAAMDAATSPVDEQSSSEDERFQIGLATTAAGSRGIDPEEVAGVTTSAPPGLSGLKNGNLLLWLLALGIAFVLLALSLRHFMLLPRGRN